MRARNRVRDLLYSAYSSSSLRLVTVFARAYGAFLGGRTVLLPDRFVVIYGLPPWTYPRGGICVGSVFLTGPAPKPSVIKHELRHVEQWRKYGLAFPLLYFLAGSDPVTNRFELEAGLEEGGYL